MVDEETSQDLIKYVDKCFRDGKDAVYFTSLFEIFKDRFQDKNMNNPEMLKQYLNFTLDKTYYFGKNYISKNKYYQPNVCESIKEYLVNAGKPVLTEKISEDLNNFDRNLIKKTIRGYGQFIRNAQNSYFYADIIKFSDDELSIISNHIEENIAQYFYISANELTEWIKRSLPDIIERYPFLSDLGLKNIVWYHLKDRFSFYGNIVSKAGEYLSISDVYAHFARSNDSFTIDQLTALRTDLGSNISFDAVYENSLRISEREFVSREEADFDIERTDNAIDQFCTGDFIPINDIDFFGSFPDAGFPWNSFLLEHYVADFSNKYKLMHTGYSVSKTSGAIVKKNSSISNYDELLSKYLAQSSINLDNSKVVLDYLCDASLLLMRRYKDIDQVMSEAKKYRLREDR